MITVTGCWQKHAKQGWQIVALPHLAEKLQRLHNVSSSLHPDADSKDDTVGAATTDIRATGVVMGDLRDATWDTTAFVELLAKLCRGQVRSCVESQGRKRGVVFAVRVPVMVCGMCNAFL